MKHLIIVFCFLLPFISFAQIDTCKLEGIMMIAKDKQGAFLYHYEWKKCDRNAIINLNINNIRIEYEGKANAFLIKEMLAPSGVEGQYAEVLMDCLDDDRKKCKVSLITLKKEVDGYRSFLKVDYNTTAIIYRFIDKDLQ